MKTAILYIGNKMADHLHNTPTTLDTLSSNLENEGFLVHTASSKKNKVIRLAHMLASVIIYSRQIKTVLIDTYSTQNFYYAVSVANLCRLLGIAYIPILHGGNLPYRLSSSPRLSRKLFMGATTNVAPSYYLFEVFKNKGFTNLQFIPNSIEINKYDFNLREYVTPKLLWVRSFSEIYNPFLAITILEELLKTYPDATLCMVGPEKDGSLKKCKAYVAKHNLPISFTGKLSKKAWTLLAKEYNVFINTTHFDNTPVSVIEAMALGVPVVSTNVGGLPYLISHNEDGLLVSPNDASLFVDAVSTLFTNPSLANRLAKNAREKIDEFDWEKVKEQWIALLRQ